MPDGLCHLCSHGSRPLGFNVLQLCFQLTVSVPGTHSCHQRLPGSKSLKLGISPQYDLRIPKIIIFVVSPESPSLSKSPLLSKHFVIPLLLTLKLAWQLGSSRSADLSTKHRSSLKRFRKNHTLKDQELKRVQHQEIHQIPGCTKNCTSSTVQTSQSPG